MAGEPLQSPAPNSDADKKWIVLIHKSPHGPLTKEEILVLLQQKVLRHNDVALLVSESQGNGWKFLWQFEEFDRRLIQVDGQFVPKKEEARSERRKDTPPPQVSPDAIPEELLNITPEELLGKSKARFSADRLSAPLENISSPEMGLSVSFINRKTVGIAGGLFLLVAIVWSLFPSSTSTRLNIPSGVSAPDEDDTRAVENGPLSGMQRPMRRPSAAVRGKLPPPPKEVEQPGARDNLPPEPERGEIPREQMDDEELADEEITEQDILEAKAFKAKKNRKKKRRPAQADEDDESGESREEPRDAESSEEPTE